MPGRGRNSKKRASRRRSRSLDWKRTFGNFRFGSQQRRASRCRIPDLMPCMNYIVSILWRTYSQVDRIGSTQNSYAIDSTWLLNSSAYER
jgi:hypothetical protein